MIYNIRDYGAAPGTMSTSAIQAAIQAAHAAGGGTVEIPAGTFECGTLELKSRVSLYLAPGAVLSASTERGDYRYIGYDHNELGKVQSLIYALDAEDIALYGEGRIDLNGDAFYDLNTTLVPPEMEETITPEQRLECTRAFEWRPNQPIFFGRSRRINVRGLKIENSPCWTVTFVECDEVRVTDLTIQNSLILPNNDGMHFCSCRDVRIRGCSITAGDDCIALTAITDWEKPCEDFIISDCVLRSCSKTIVLGYMHTIVRNVIISNVIMRGCNRGLCFMASPGTGLVENVTVSNVHIETRVAAGNWWGNGEAILFIGTYHHAYGAPAPQRDNRVSFRNFAFTDLTVETENVIGIVGEGKNTEAITFRGLRVSLRESANRALKGYIAYLAPSKQTPTIPQDGKEYWLLLRDVRDVHFEGVTVQPFKGTLPAAAVIDCEDVTGL